MCDELVYHGYEGWGRCPRDGVVQVTTRYSARMVCEEHALEHRARELRSTEQAGKSGGSDG